MDKYDYKLGKKIDDVYYMLTGKGYHVIYIGLYGSQNYNLHDDESDVDVRAIVLPSVDDLITNKTISKTYKYEFGEVDVKDLWTYYQVIRKGNPSFIEPFVSDYWVGMNYIRDLFKDTKPNPKALHGMMLQKVKRYKKDVKPKDLLHAIRIENMFFLNGGEPIVPDKCFDVYSDGRREGLLNVKRGELVIKPENVDHFFELESIEDLIKGYKYEPIDREDEIIKYIKMELGL